VTARHLLVGNPGAQSGTAALRIEGALEQMRNRGWSVELLTTEGGGRTPALVAQAIAAQRPEVVICLGGDGTFAEVAKGILATTPRVPLGLLPAGTANDQGRSFGISASPADLARNLDVVAARHLTWLDVGQLGRLDRRGRIDASNQVFHSVGFGLQPEILAERNRDRAAVSGIPLLGELYVDEAVYFGAALKRTVASWFEPTKFDAAVVIDGRHRRFERLTDVIINATPCYGGSWVFDRTAEVDDGKFELVPVTGRRDFLAKAIQHAVDGPIAADDLAALGFEPSTILSGSEFELTFKRLAAAGVASQVDGEEWLAGAHFRLSVLKRELPIITPADFVPPWRAGAAR